ncbi:ADP-ribosylation factor family-domain-containing protein [Gloeopeniophorella convolvens]|nr:ADP-ribosylation factor family-domain-containing protein [Gloeopeniophorella convolvens]
MGLSVSSLFGSLSSLLRWSKDQDVRILMLGLDSAGKAKSYQPYPVWDLGGQSSIRFSDHARLETSRSELLTMLSEEELAGVPLLVFCNKQDVENALKPEAISEELGLAGGEKGRDWSVRGSCAVKGEGIEEGLDWLVNAIQKK